MRKNPDRRFPKESFENIGFMFKKKPNPPAKASGPTSRVIEGFVDFISIGECRSGGSDFVKMNEHKEPINLDTGFSHTVTAVWKFCLLLHEKDFGFA
jgi:hypothetical protein